MPKGDTRAQARRRRQRRLKAGKQMILDTKMSSGCVDCGFNLHPAALSFDHRDPSQKKFEISKRGWQNVSLDRLADEIDKCDVRCLNRHSIRHANEHP